MTTFFWWSRKASINGETMYYTAFFAEGARRRENPVPTRTKKGAKEKKNIGQSTEGKKNGLSVQPKGDAAGLYVIHSSFYGFFSSPHTRIHIPRVQAQKKNTKKNEKRVAKRN